MGNSSHWYHSLYEILAQRLEHESVSIVDDGGREPLTRGQRQHLTVQCTSTDTFIRNNQKKVHMAAARLLFLSLSLTLVYPICFCRSLSSFIFGLCLYLPLFLCCLSWPLVFYLCLCLNLLSILLSLYMPIVYMYMYVYVYVYVYVVCTCICLSISSFLFVSVADSRLLFMYLSQPLVFPFVSV